MIIELLFKMLFAHAVGDFGLQSDVMAYCKNRHNTPKNVPAGQQPMPVWGWWLSSHTLINGAAFYLFTGNIYIGMLETLLHVCIDFAKTENKTNPNIDQILHLLSIILYLVLMGGKSS